MGKIAYNIVEIQHNVDYQPKEGGAIGKNRNPIQSFLVKKNPSGNVTITLNANNSNINGQTCNVITFPSTAFTAGRYYYMEIAKVNYANSGDQADPPLLGIY